MLVAEARTLLAILRLQQSHDHGRVRASTCSDTPQHHLPVALSHAADSSNDERPGRKLSKELLTRPFVVGDTGIEPVTSSVSRKRSPTELIARGGSGNRTRVQGFAGPCLSHSAIPPGHPGTTVFQVLEVRRGPEVSPSGRRDSNPRPSPWQGDALPAALRPRVQRVRCVALVVRTLAQAPGGFHRHPPPLPSVLFRRHVSRAPGRWRGAPRAPCRSRARSTRSTGARTRRSGRGTRRESGRRS